MASLKADCRKFAPNIFNKTKCQNCFRGKDVHSAEALESNRATRKICLCSYLFVAPDWDFSLPANRNKRWQRRWFILYDDGELAYSVDECPETVPQAVIDMNCVLEVTDAEAITGHQFALAITLSEKVHFIKGTNKEESKKWFEVLSRFPRNTVCGKYKRNATFPGIKTVSNTKSENNFTDWVNKKRPSQVSEFSNNSHNVSNLRTMKKQSSFSRFHHEEDDIPTKDTNSFKKNPQNELSSRKEAEEKATVNYKLLNDEEYLIASLRQSESETVGKSANGQSASTHNTLRDSIKERFLAKADNCRHYLKSEMKKQHSQSDITPMIPSLLRAKSESEWKKITSGVDSGDENCHHNPVYVLMSDVPSRRRYESCEKFFRSETLHRLQRQSSFGKKSDLSKLTSLWRDCQLEGEDNRTIHKSASVPNAVILSEKAHTPVGSLFNNAYTTSRKKLSFENKSLLEQVSLERGDPDGCNLDSLPSQCDQANEQNSETYSFKKGWLVKQDQSKWNKHWFVLRNSALAYYSDPIAEDSGILDGMIDLRKVRSVSEVQSSSGHTFSISMKDESTLFLSAITAKMRNNWIRAILQVAKLKCDTLPKKRSNGIHSSQEPVDSCIRRNPSASSIDSESPSEKNDFGNPHSNRQELDDHVPNHPSLSLPLSPPLARTAISRVKERARSRSHSRSRRCNSTEIHATEHGYLMDSDDGATDHSSSSLSNTPVFLPKEEKVMVVPTKQPPANTRSERQLSLKLLRSDSLSYKDKRIKVLEIKDKLEDSSWAVWLDVSKFCKEIEAKLDDYENVPKSKVLKNGDLAQGVAVERKKDITHLIMCLVKVEKKLHKVHDELAKTKTDLLLGGKEIDLEPATCKNSTSSMCNVADVNSTSSSNVLFAQQLHGLKEENRRLKQDVKTSQSSSDTFELNCISLKQELKQKHDLHQSQMDLMVARVDDLTMKLLNSEKTVRQLRQRVMKLEQRVERRRSSLKGKEAISLSKEYETKLSELEQKIDSVEVALRGSAEVADPALASEKDNLTKESQNMLMRLHNLDKKVKTVIETVEQPIEKVNKAEDFTKPKICLQIKTEENVTNADTCEDWNSLSLSTSMTDLTNSENLSCEEERKDIALSFHDCLENLNYKVTSLIQWLKTNLQLMYKNNDTLENPNNPSNNHSSELEQLVCALDKALGVSDNTAIITQDVNNITQNVLYKMVTLQEISTILFRMSNFEKFRDVVIIQHLMRIKQVVSDLEEYIIQKSNSVSVGSQRITLCNIIANLLFCRVPLASHNATDLPDVTKLFEEVESSKKKVSSTIFLFKEKFIKNFCTTIVELSDKPTSSNSSEKENEVNPSGQKQFLSHVNHIVTQVLHSFVSHISKSLSQVYVLVPNVQYSSQWTSYICKLLQQELMCLLTEIKNSCIQHLESDFYSGSKCGVLVEYMHCSIWELAQIVSVNSVAEGTVVLIKNAIFNKSLNHCRQVHSGEGESIANCDITQMDTQVFHEDVLQRTKSIMCNLSMSPSSNVSWNFCNMSEINVAYRSVSSLLCFKQKLRASTENEHKVYKMQIELLNQKLGALWEEQKIREQEGCKTCIELRQEVSYLQGELDESRAIACSGGLCEKCLSLKMEIQKLMEQHERDTFLIQRLEEHESKWKKQIDDVVKEKEQMFDEEKRKFAAELQSAQQLLKNMENQYDEDLSNLQSLYEKKVSQPQSDVWKCRYSIEIDQLKSLCQKGLEVMEISHKKAITELEERHQSELDHLAAEKDKVLAEEAQATAVALEAVRKAHNDEFQRQIQLFKEDFMRKMSAKIETEAFKRGYETEITKVKHEILTLAEKYSVKCLENINLQESLGMISDKLKASNNQVVELQTRNKLLKARLDSEVMQKLEELNTSATYL